MSILDTIANNTLANDENVNDEETSVSHQTTETTVQNGSDGSNAPRSVVNLVGKLGRCSQPSAECDHDNSICRDRFCPDNDAMALGNES